MRLASNMLLRIMTVDFLFIGLQEIKRVQTTLAQLSFSSNIS
jgi:hypothetical protein